MRLSAAIGAALILTTPAQAETPTVFLHCIGETPDHKGTEHTIALYSKLATVDDLQFKAVITETYYEIDDVDVAMSIMSGHSFMAINRLTGSYQIQSGLNLADTVVTEYGTCDKVDRKL